MAANSSQRTRHSSSTSTTQDTASFQFYQGQGGQGPASLPPSMFTSVAEGAAVDPAMYTSWDPNVQQTPTGTGSNTAMSRSCDSLVQTDISAVLTPKAEVGEGSIFHLKTVDIPIDGEETPNPSLSDSKSSPRPSTLPGLNPNGSAGKKRGKSGMSGIPGLKQLAGQAILSSPQAPTQVKAFARTLVDDCMTDTMSKGISDSLQVDDGTDISFSLANDDAKSPPSPTANEISVSSHVETDSLEESCSPKKFSSRRK